MAITQTLRPFRDYDEKDVINLYTYSGSVVDAQYKIQATKGTIVKIAGDGFRNDVEPLEMLGNFGAFNVNNWVGQRYGVVPKVTAGGTGDANYLGMLLFDVRELDENELPLKYNPRKAAEMEAVLSGQAVPVVTRGIFLYSGITTGVNKVAVTAGNPVYVNANGGLTSDGQAVSAQTVSGGYVPAYARQKAVGTFLGTTGSVQATGNQYGTDNSAIALVWLNIT